MRGGVSGRKRSREGFMFERYKKWMRGLCYGYQREREGWRLGVGGGEGVCVREREREIRGRYG